MVWGFKVRDSLLGLFLKKTKGRRQLLKNLERIWDIEEFLIPQLEQNDYEMWSQEEEASTYRLGIRALCSKSVREFT